MFPMFLVCLHLLVPVCWRSDLSSTAFHGTLPASWSKLTALTGM